jgi:MerR family mercuric resistance operon transcriptional regulator
MKKTSSPYDFVTRGHLAKEMGCNIETIRYYEKIALMPPPKRSESGYRLYGEDERRRLHFILRGRDLGFSIKELHSLLSLVDSNDYTCGEVHEITGEHLDNVRAKLNDLHLLERSLAEIHMQCKGGTVPECPVINVLFEG